MIKFVDLDTGNVFEGLSPYTFWFDNDMGTGMIHTKTICFISTNSTETITINNNEIFKIINPQNINNDNKVIINSFEYYNIENLINEDNSITLNGHLYNGYYVYFLYIIAKATTPGSYQEFFYIDNPDKPYTIGAEFYSENESLYINLSNLGVEIPEAIQKAFYTSNVHEDKRDNILLNRKFKELLSNYWDVIANRGSYKSLINSLKWFEYGDLVSLKEIWSHTENDITTYFEQDIHTTMKEKYHDHMINTSKTTYMALNLALERDAVGKYDEYKNPLLEKIISDVTIEDLSLKMSMLGNFYETYFMPIHTDLIRSTIENVVYTTPIKLASASYEDRSDHYYNIHDFECNIKNNSTYKLGIVKCYVYPDLTLFGVNYSPAKHDYINCIKPMGVQRELFHGPVSGGNMPNDDIKTFLYQLYNDVGSIIDFSVKLPLNDNDKIKRESLRIIARNGKSVIMDEYIVDHKIIADNHINFSILCALEGDYDVILQFDSVMGEVYTKKINFNIVDTGCSGLRIYKIKNDGITSHDHFPKTTSLNDYMIGFYFNTDSANKFKQYIPVNMARTTDEDYDGVKLNHMIILQPGYAPNDYITANYNYKILTKSDGDYHICISKQFGFKPDLDKFITNSIYKQDNIFIEDYHKFEELGFDRGFKKEDIKYYTVTDNDALCIIPDIPHGRYINKYTWEFINLSDPKSGPIKLNSKEPFISDVKKSLLSPGYYSILFRYSFAGNNEINEIHWDSAFLKK